MAIGQKKQAQEKINKEQFEKLCKLQCTETEISAYFEISHDTLQRWCEETYGENFAYVYEQKKRSRKDSIKTFSITTG